jgi:SAM-dependent methyltransferase
MSDESKKLVADQKEWNLVVKDLEAENLKLASYDNTLLEALGDIRGKEVLDYGAGPGVLALAIKRLGGSVKVWDINPAMRQKAGEKIGTENVYPDVSALPSNFFDIIIANLLLCIVPEDEVRAILKNITASLKADGEVYIGFCNPKIFDVKESQLDLRFPTGQAYEENHDYKKVKKEGGYEIIETHRPIEWYEKVYAEAGLKLVDTIFTPEYELNGLRIRDFVIFRLRKA